MKRLIAFVSIAVLTLCAAPKGQSQAILDETFTDGIYVENSLRRRRNTCDGSN